MLRFNSAKCKVLHLGENNPRYNYFIKEGNTVRELLETTSEKDLGVYIDPNLTFNDHIEITVKKARSLSGLINHAITYKGGEIMIPLYKAFIRPRVVLI